MRGEEGRFWVGGVTILWGGSQILGRNEEASLKFRTQPRNIQVT